MCSKKNMLHRLIKGVGIVVLSLIVVILCILLCFWLSFRIKLFITKPKTEDLLNYAREVYQKEFILIKEYTKTTFTDGEAGARTEIRSCPAVELKDPSTGIVFHVDTRWPVDSWDISDDYGCQVLLFCIKEQGIMLSEESLFEPCLVLENSRSEAEKLQQMTIRYNEIYSVDCTKKKYAQNMFMVPGSLYSYHVKAGYISDRWLNETTPFCYDTPLEKYEAFLNEVVG